MKNRNMSMLREIKNTTVCAPFARLEIVKNGPRNQCATLYNVLPKMLKSITNYKIFRKETRSYLTQKCYYNIDEYLYMSQKS